MKVEKRPGPHWLKRESKRPKYQEISDDECYVISSKSGRMSKPHSGADSEDEGDVVVTGAAGDVAIKDYPHPRHTCVLKPFSKLLPMENAQHCKKCWCFACDKPASSCSAWGTGISATDHCHANDNSTLWKAEREKLKAGTPQTRPSTEPAPIRQNPPPVNPPRRSPGTLSARKNPFPVNTARPPPGTFTAARPAHSAEYVTVGSLTFEIKKHPAARTLLPTSLRCFSTLFERHRWVYTYVDPYIDCHIMDQLSALDDLQYGKITIESLTENEVQLSISMRTNKLSILHEEAKALLRAMVQKMSGIQEAISEADKLMNKITYWNCNTTKGLLEELETKEYEEMEQPEGLTVKLRNYQKQSLRFMLDKERHVGGFKGIFWRKLPGAGNEKFDVIYSPFLNMLKLKKKNSDSARTGGFLGESMGMGKTVEVLALILANPSPPLPPSTEDLLTGEDFPPGGYPSKATLVVCPVSLVGQWVSEAESKLSGNTKVYRYYGSNRRRNIKQLAKYDIVVTTYATLGSDWKDYTAPQTMLDTVSSPLHAIKWWRIILDESHAVRNPNVSQSRACQNLLGDRRWCCTGTPICTDVKDLFGQLLFLKLKPLCKPTIFQKLMEKGGRNPNKDMFGTAFAMVKHITVRHTKQQQFDGCDLLELPPKTQVDIKLTLPAKEREHYKLLAETARKKYNKFRSGGGIYEVQRNMLEINSLLLPVRRFCSGSVVPLTDPSSVKKSICDNCQIEDLMLYQGNCEDRCCMACWQVLGRKNKMVMNCPVCKTCVRVSKLKVCAAKTREEASGESVHSEVKFKALMEDVTKVHLAEPSAKVLIFSQFTETLDSIKPKLTDAGLQYCYLHGSMTATKRSKAIEAFQKDPPTTVFLLSLRTGAVGITLTAASYVYLLEPILNPAVEEQAIGRVWRMGQTRPVTVKRLYVEDSVEENIMKVVTRRSEGYSATNTKAVKGKISYVAGAIVSEKEVLRVGDFDILFGWNNGQL